MSVLDFKQSASESAGRPSAISIKNVLYATDFSATSEAALPYASAICRRFGSTLHVAHVLSDANLLLMTGGVDYVSVGAVYDDSYKKAQEKIDQVATRLGKIQTRTYVRHGMVWKNLSQIIADNQIDLVVVGTHGRTGVGKLLLGSVAEDILRHSPCPVLTVGPKVCGRAKLPEYGGSGQEIAPAELELQRIVFATNLTPASLTVVPVAISLVKEFDARLTLMHVVEDSAQEDRAEPIASGVRNLQAVLPSEAGLAYQPEFVVEFGSPWDCIVNTAAEREADLIVLGAHRADGATHVPWSTVHRVVANASCPVLTVRE